MGTQSVLLCGKPLKFMHSFWNLHGKVNKEQHILLLSLETLLFWGENICVKGKPYVIRTDKNENGFHTQQRGGIGFYFLHCKGVVTLFLYLSVSYWEVQTGKFRLFFFQVTSRGYLQRKLLYSCFLGTETLNAELLLPVEVLRKTAKILLI